MTAKEVIKLLEKNGWVFLRSRGSHYQYGKNKETITVAYHKGDVPIGTLNSILKKAGLK